MPNTMAMRGVGCNSGTVVNGTGLSGPVWLNGEQATSSAEHTATTESLTNAQLSESLLKNALKHFRLLPMPPEPRPCAS